METSARPELKLRMLFSDLDSALPKLAKRQPVEAAVLAAMPVLECIAPLQLSARQADSQTANGFGQRCFRLFGPRLGPDLERLDLYLTDEVVDGLSMLHPLPVVIGDTIEESYTEAVFDLGCRWYRALVTSIPLNQTTTGMWKQALAPVVPREFKAIQLSSAQCEAARDSLFNSPMRPADVSEKYLHVAIRKEAQRITGKRLPRYDHDDESGPPLQLLKDATAQQQKMLEALWNKPHQKKRDFIAAVWGAKGATEEAMERAIGRLGNFLLEQNFPATVQLNGNLVILTLQTK